MKLVFKYNYYDSMYSKGYTKICMSCKEINEIAPEKNLKEFWKVVMEKKFLDEVFLSSYLDDLDLRVSKWTLKKLKDKNIDYDDISSQGWEALIENNKVYITYIFNDENDSVAVMNREEVIYAVEKWQKFLEKEITDPDYQEIIDTNFLCKSQDLEIN